MTINAFTVLAVMFAGWGFSYGLYLMGVWGWDNTRPSQRRAFYTITGLAFIFLVIGISR
jgi:hypothetical protein